MQGPDYSFHPTIGGAHAVVAICSSPSRICATECLGMKGYARLMCQGTWSLVGGTMRVTDRWAHIGCHKGDVGTEGLDGRIPRRAGKSGVNWADAHIPLRKMMHRLRSCAALQRPRPAVPPLGVERIAGAQHVPVFAVQLSSGQPACLVRSRSFPTERLTGPLILPFYFLPIPRGGNPGVQEGVTSLAMGEGRAHRILGAHGILLVVCLTLRVPKSAHIAVVSFVVCLSPTVPGVVGVPPCGCNAFTTLQWFAHHFPCGSYNGWYKSLPGPSHAPITMGTRGSYPPRSIFPDSL